MSYKRSRTDPKHWDTKAGTKTHLLRDVPIGVLARATAKCRAITPTLSIRHILIELLYKYGKNWPLDGTVPDEPMHPPKAKASSVQLPQEHVPDLSQSF